MKKKLIVANWKMNKNPEQSKNFVESLKNEILNTDFDLVICPPFTSIYAIKSYAEEYHFDLGAQNCFWEEKGAFTGEISPSMIYDLGAKYVILGHSERRNYFNENDTIINKKLIKVFENKIIPILCVGEDVIHRKENKAYDFVSNQLEKCFYGVKITDFENLIVAYEPVWSIGTGITMKPEEADKMCLFIKNFLFEKYGKNLSTKVKILYGGSLNENNSRDFLNMKNIDGGLIGGASLKKESFAKIIH